MKTDTKPEKSNLKRPVIYIARDIERALGMMMPTANTGHISDYYIIAGRTAYAEEIQKKYPDNVMLAGDLLDTHEILIVPEVAAEIDRRTKKDNAAILVFKNTLQIERIAREKGWTLLNPSAELAEKIENKITQAAWLGDLAKYLPEHKVVKVRDIVAGAKGTPFAFPFIMQWAHSHTGDGTILVSKQPELDKIAAIFPDREARVSQYIQGPTFTTNVVAGMKSPNISYQITGMLPFTENPWSTVGNDWSLPHSLLTEEHVATIDNICSEVAERMSKAGWRGLFGLDFMHDMERDRIHLLEINARQPASTTYESQLQMHIRSHGVPGLTTFETHLQSLTGSAAKSAAQSLELIPLNDGAQIIQRVAKPLLAQTTIPTEEIFGKLESAGYAFIQYENLTPNSDKLRIQCARGIMEAHNKFNKRGKQILEIMMGVEETEDEEMEEEVEAGNEEE